MKNKFIAFLLFTAALLTASISVFAIQDEEEKYPTVDKKKVEKKVEKKGWKKIGNLTIDITASDIIGYDSNVNLDRYDEDASLFMQNEVGIYGRYPVLSDLVTLRGSYSATWIKYFKFSDPDLLDQILGAGFDMKIADKFLWSVDYTADFVGFPHDEQSEYTMNQVETKIRHNITNWLYQKIGYQFSYKHYPRLKIRNSWGTYRLGDRRDKRNAVIHELGLYLGKKTFIRAENKVYYNDSNEQYLNYYDYRALKTKVGIVQLITKKLYETVNFAYQYKAFDKRSVSASDEDQRDHLFIWGGSIFYDITPSVSIGASFDYRDNYSNENVQRYEDFIISSGVYCSF